MLVPHPLNHLSWGKKYIPLSLELVTIGFYHPLSEAFLGKDKHPKVPLSQENGNTNATPYALEWRTGSSSPIRQGTLFLLSGILEWKDTKAPPKKKLYWRNRSLKIRVGYPPPFQSACMIPPKIGDRNRMCGDHIFSVR